MTAHLAAVPDEPVLFSGEVHPLAAAFPMLSDDELDELAESIATNGLVEPLTLDQQGRLVDGRNRLEACRRAGKDPRFVTADLILEESIAEFIGAKNADRRHLTSGQQAMGRALMLQAAGRRKNGRWERGSIANTDNRISAEQDAMRKAGQILDVADRAAALGEDFHDYTLLPRKVMHREDGITLASAHRMAEQFDVNATIAEAMKAQPLVEALMKASVLLDDLEAILPLPTIPVPLTKQHHDQIKSISRRGRQIAARFTTHGGNE